MENKSDILTSVVCPICKLNTTIILDYKNVTSDELIYLCQNCGTVYKEKNPLTISKISDNKKEINT